MNNAEFNQFILSEMPHFIAVNYQRLLEAKTPQERVERALQIYNLVLRTLTIDLVSQYLILDRVGVRHPYLNYLLLQKFPRLTLDDCQELLFTTLKTYEGRQNLFFMPELYQVYWDPSQSPLKRQPDVERPFERLTQISLESKTAQLLPSGVESWEQLAEETTRLLHQVLQNWAFIGKYDLIRVLGHDEHSYTFELHKGLTVSGGTQSISKQHDLNRGWFYLRKGPEAFLLLHPLIVFWEGVPSGNGLIQTDTGVYDRFLYERLHYRLTTSSRSVVDDKNVARFMTFFYHTIKKVKHKREEEVEKLAWWHLRTICADITKQRMANVQGKYNAKLYLQREKMRQAFEQFLNSKVKKCFVLIGKSGVGKSNFILSIGEELQQAQYDKWCVLMYDGADPFAEPSITKSIGQDFNLQLKPLNWQIEDVWEEIEHIEGIEERGLILYVDAINENSQANELLRHLDTLVRKPWPWLKVVIGSRPEMWQTIKRGVKLAENLYYCEEGTETIGVEIEPFSDQELPMVYMKYQQTFNLQTPYEPLRSRNDLWELLRDPFNLWLVAKTYKGNTIPETLKSTELIEKYIHELLRHERLRNEDLRLLEIQLVPLMVRERRNLSNTITVADIDAAGVMMNQSFINLRDTDILIMQGEWPNQKIAFKYERFYEYFAGKRIFKLSESWTDKPAAFTEMICHVNKAPFLWGAIKNALIQEIQEHGFEIVLSLCFTKQQEVKEMIVAVLTDLGRDHQAEVEMILEHLLPSKERLSKFRSVLALLGKVNIKSDLRTRNARRIATEVASHLNIHWVLQTAAMQADPTIRTAMVRYTYYLWQHNQKEGFEVLQKIAQSATSSLIPNLTAFESVLVLWLLIFFDSLRDENHLKKMQEIWRDMIARMFAIRTSGNSWRERLRAFIRERIFSFVITAILQISRKTMYFNYLYLEVSFQQGTAEKAFYRKLIQYFDSTGSYSQEQMQQDFLSVLGIKDMLTEVVVRTGLMVHALQAPLTFLPFLKRFFHEAQKVPSPNVEPLLVVYVLTDVLDHDPMLDEVFDFFVHAVEFCQEYYTKNSPNPGYEDVRLAPEAIYLASYLHYQYQRTGNIRTNWLETRINAAIESNNLRFFELLLRQELYMVGVTWRKPQIALDTLGLFFNCHNKEIKRMIQNFLARLRLHYPNEVDDFLAEQEASVEFRSQVLTNEPNETVGELIGMRFWHFLRDDIIMGSPLLRIQLMGMFAKVTDCKNAKEWLNYMSREVINLLCNEEILYQIK